MKRVFQMAMKDLKLLARDRVGIFFMLVFPVLMGVFFGFVMGNVGNDPESTKLEIVVADNDDSEFSKKFVDSLKNIETLDVAEADYDSASNDVRLGRKLAVISVPKGFGETAGIMWADAPELELGLDPSRSAESAMLEGMLMQAMGDLINARFQDPSAMRSFVDDGKARIAAAEDLSPIQRGALNMMMGSFDTMFDALETVQSDGDNNGGENNPLNRGMQLANIKRTNVARTRNKSAIAEKIDSRWDISFPQSMVWGVLGCVAGFATLTVRERTLGTLTRLQVAPIPRWQILAGKGLGCFIGVMGVIIFMMAVGTMLGMRPKSWPLLIVAAGSTAFCFVGIMMLLSLLGKTEQATGGMAWGACTVMAMFGGGMLPLAFMPGFMRKLANYDPVGWAVYAVEGAVWRGLSVAEMVLPCAILCGVGLATMMLGSYLISRRTA